jgi:hypothetical protein
MFHKLRLGAILIIIIIIIIIRNGAKTISLQTSFGDLIIIIIIRKGAKTISLQTSLGDLIRNGANTIFVWGTYFN